MIVLQCQKRGYNNKLMIILQCAIFGLGAVLIEKKKKKERCHVNLLLKYIFSLKNVNFNFNF